MKSIVTAIVGASLLVSSLGCAICDNCHDNNYGAVGGMFERTDQNGRVGSSFSPHQPTVGKLGTLEPSTPMAQEHDRPRDLSGDAILDGDNGVTPQNTRPRLPGDVGPPSRDDIPDFDSGDFNNLLEEIPGDDAIDEFPGDVNATPLQYDSETPSNVLTATALETVNESIARPSSESVNSEDFSLATPTIAISEISIEKIDVLESEE